MHHGCNAACAAGIPSGDFAHPCTWAVMPRCYLPRCYLRSPVGCDLAKRVPHVNVVLFACMPLLRCMPAGFTHELASIQEVTTNRLFLAHWPSTLCLFCLYHNNGVGLRSGIELAFNELTPCAHTASQFMLVTFHVCTMCPNDNGPVIASLVTCISPVPWWLG